MTHQFATQGHRSPSMENAGDVDVHVVHPDRDLEGADLDRCFGVLSVDEREQAERFVVPRDRVLFVTARATLRFLLSARSTRPPEEWRFERDRFGRPHALDAPAELAFSVSHTQGAVVVALTRGRAVGVDVEYVDANRPVLAIARKYFAPWEARTLETTASQKRALQFCAHWTLKEAYAKARGLGLHLPLNLCALQIDGDHVAPHISNDSGDSADRWVFGLRRFKTPHVLGVVAERMDREPVLQFWGGTPGRKPTLLSREAFS